MRKQKPTIKQLLIDKINKTIEQYYPNKGLSPLNDNMDNPNEIADYAVVARYINYDLYYMYLDVEGIVVSGENKRYLSSYGKKLKAFNDLGSVSKFFYKISHKEEKELI